jgi:hypothetical protein
MSTSDCTSSPCEWLADEAAIRGLQPTKPKREGSLFFHFRELHEKGVVRNDSCGQQLGIRLAQTPGPRAHVGGEENLGPGNTKTQTTPRPLTPKSRIDGSENPEVINGRLVACLAGFLLMRVFVHFVCL